MHRRLLAAALAMVAVLGAGACSAGEQEAAALAPTSPGIATPTASTTPTASATPTTAAASTTTSQANPGGGGAPPPPPPPAPPPDNTPAVCDSLLQTSEDIGAAGGRIVAALTADPPADLSARQAAAHQFAADMNAIRASVNQAASTATNAQVKSAANQYASALGDLAGIATAAGDTGDLDSIMTALVGPEMTAVFETVDQACGF